MMIGMAMDYEKVSYFVLTMLSNSRSLKVHRSKAMITGVIRDSYTEAIELMLIIDFIPHNFSCLGEQRVSKEGFVEWMLGI